MQKEAKKNKLYAEVTSCASEELELKDKGIFIHIREQGLTDADAIAIAEALKVNKTLTLLQLRNIYTHQ
jgi:phenylpyruvate tautomerase PptA (4-oxalocrotonate tautomerase family)